MSKKISVHDLEGDQLDAQVAAALGGHAFWRQVEETRVLMSEWGDWSPTEDYFWIGKLIDDFKIRVARPKMPGQPDTLTGRPIYWLALEEGNSTMNCVGETLGDAVCRAVVRAKFGNEVEGIDI